MLLNLSSIKKTAKMVIGIEEAGKSNAFKRNFKIKTE